MALRLRRGTDAERLIMEPPAAGELIYTTDTKAVWVGDGATVGGLPVSGAAINLDDLGNVIITEPNPGDVLQYTGSQWVSAPSPDKTGNVYGEDSTLLIDTDNSVIVGPIVTSTPIIGDLVGDVTGNLTGNADGNHTGTFTGTVSGSVDGDLTGSVFADDSSTIVDAVNQTITAQTVTTGILEASESTISNIITTGFTASGQGQLIIQRDTAVDTSSDNVAYGNVVFRVNDANGLSATKSLIQAGRRYIRFINDSNDIIVGTSPDTTNMTWFDNKLLVGGRTTSDPERLQVIGDASVTGYLDVQQIRVVGNSISTTESNANLEISANGTGTIQLNVPTQSSVGSAGGASAIPATPDIYFKVNVNGTEYVVPGFAVS